MGIAEWWGRLDGGTRQWLADHAGEDVPAGVLARIAAATGPADDQPWWVPGAPGALRDEAVDWIEAVANEETPPPPRFAGW